MPHFSANLSWLFQEAPFLDRFALAAEAGFEAVEFLFPYDHPPEAIRARLDAHRLTQVLFNAPPGDWAAGERGLAALPGREAEFRAGVERALHYAAALGCRMLHVMAGIAPPTETHRDQLIDNLLWACRRAARQDVTLLVEALNTTDMPGYFYSRIPEVVAIIDTVDEPNLKLQLDLYHCQMMQGDLTRNVRDHIGRAGHVQIAGVPGRHEPDWGEINYPFLFDLLDELGYAGWVGAEYGPRAGTLAGLGWWRAATGRRR